jgi:hypothetical protein
MRAEPNRGTPVDARNDRRICLFLRRRTKERAVAEQGTILITRSTNITVTPDS